MKTTSRQTSRAAGANARACGDNDSGTGKIRKTCCCCCCCCCPGRSTCIKIHTILRYASGDASRSRIARTSATVLPDYRPPTDRTRGRRRPKSYRPRRANPAPPIDHARTTRMPLEMANGGGGNSATRPRWKTARNEQIQSCVMFTDRGIST